MAQSANYATAYPIDLNALLPPSHEVAEVEDLGASKLKLSAGRVPLEIRVTKHVLRP